MRKRRLHLGLLLLAVAAGVLVVVRGGGREPEYGGKRLSQWVGMLGREAIGKSGRHERERAEEAVRRIGTNAVPYLLQWIAYHPAHWKYKLYVALHQKLDWPRDDWLERDPRILRAAGAVEAFGTLGPDVQGAVGGLTELMVTSDPEFGVARSAEALAGMGGPGVAALVSVLTNGQGRFRAVAADWLGLTGTNGESAVPVLLACLEDNDWEVAMNAATSLGRLRLQPVVVVPALMKSVGSSNLLVRQMAAMSLGWFGTNGQAAAGVLAGLLADPAFEMRAAATNALRKIDPKALETNNPLLLKTRSD